MKKKEWSCPCNRPCRPIGLWDVEAHTFSKRSVQRWRWDCQPYAPAALYPKEDSWYSFLLEAESIHSEAGRISSIEKSYDLTGIRTWHLPACSVVLQPPHAEVLTWNLSGEIIIIIYFNCKWVFIRWQWYYNKTQQTNNTTIKWNTAHKTTHTIKDTLHTMNTITTTRIEGNHEEYQDIRCPGRDSNRTPPEYRDTAMLDCSGGTSLRSCRLCCLISLSLLFFKRHMLS
jgi:hypothetical protein